MVKIVMGLLRGGEPVLNFDQPIQGVVAGAVCIGLDDLEGCQRQLTGDVVGASQRWCYVQSAPQEVRRYAAQPLQASGDGILFEEGMVSEVVRDQPGEAKTQPRVQPACAWLLDLPLSGIRNAWLPVSADLVIIAEAAHLTGEVEVYGRIVRDCMRQIKRRCGNLRPFRHIWLKVRA